MILSAKDLVLFQCITCWVRESISTVGYVRAMGAKTMGNLDKAVSSSVGKVQHVCMSSAYFGDSPKSMKYFKM